MAVEELRAVGEDSCDGVPDCGSVGDCGDNVEGEDENGGRTDGKGCAGFVSGDGNDAGCHDDVGVVGDPERCSEEGDTEKSDGKCLFAKLGS